jgi:hypothetical protein
MKLHFKVGSDNVVGIGISDGKSNDSISEIFIDIQNKDVFIRHSESRTLYINNNNNIMYFVVFSEDTTLQNLLKEIKEKL